MQQNTLLPSADTGDCSVAVINTLNGSANVPPLKTISSDTDRDLSITVTRLRENATRTPYANNNAICK